MKTIADYNIVSEIGITELAIAVNGFMFEGWQPFGGPFVDPRLEDDAEPDSVMFCQAMVRYAA